MQEKMLKDLEANMALPSYAKSADHDKVFHNHEKTKSKVAALYEEWEKTNKLLENFQSI